jgi:broad specificity phosphatase PhoE
MSSDDAVPPSSDAAKRTFPLTTSVFVIRHAESVANAGSYFASQSDSPLTELGVEQAKRLAEGMAAVSLHAIYSSDLSRAHHTIEPLAGKKRLPVVQTSMLRERHMGELTGMTFEAAKAKYPDVWARLVARDPMLRPPGGESHVDVGDRVRRLLDGLHREHRGCSFALASHGGTIHHILRQLMGIHDLAMPLWLSVDNASVSRVDLVEPATGVLLPRLVYVNRTFEEGEALRM